MSFDNDNNLSATVGMDTTDFKSGVTELNAQIKHIERSFQATAAVMDDWGNSSDGLKKRVTSLGDKISLQKKKLELLNSEYQKTVKEQGENSAAAESLAQKMYKTQQEIQRSEKSLKNYEDRLSELGIVSEKTAKKLQNIGENISKVGNTLTLGVTAPIIAAGTAAYKLSSDLTEAENKTEAVFKNQTASIKEWANEALNNMGLAKSTALDAVSLYGDMATSMDLSISSSVEMSKKLVELSADMASFKNVSIETAQNALKGVFTGETESLKNLGIVMTETQLKAYALANGYAKAYDEMSQAEKVQLRYKYVLENSSNAIGDFSRTQDEAANQMRKLPEALKELGASFGENVAPTITPAVKSLNSLIQSFGKLDDKSKNTIVTTAAIAAGVGPVLSLGGKAITTVGKTISALKKMDSTFKVLKTSATATKASLGALGIVIAAISAAVVVAQNQIQDAIENIEEHYDSEIEASNKAHDAIIDNLEKEKEEYETALDSKIQEQENHYNNLINNLSSVEKAQRKAIEKERELYQKAHSERMEQLEKERDLKLSMVDTDEDNRVSAIQAEIDAIDAITEAEEKALKEQENAEKLSELQRAIDYAMTYQAKQSAIKEYSDFVAELERESTLEQREQQKQQLQDKISAINAEADARREQINEEFNIYKNAEEEKYEAAIENYDLRLEALDGYVGSETERLENLKNSNIERLKSETEAYIEELQARIDKANERKEAAEAALEAEKELKVKEASKGEKWSLRWMMDEAIEQLKNKDSDFYKFGDKLFGWVPGYNASGTDDWRGGPTWVNEEGGEIINLPRHTQIIPHDVSMEAAREYAKQRAITNNQNSTTNNYNYAARQQVNVFSLGGRVIAQEIIPETSQGLSSSLRARRRAGVVAKK